MPSLRGSNVQEHSTGTVLLGEQAGFCGSPQNPKTTDPRPQLRGVNSRRRVAGVSTELMLTHGPRHRSHSSYAHKAHLCVSQPGWPSSRHLRLRPRYPGRCVDTAEVLAWLRHTPSTRPGQMEAGRESCLGALTRQWIHHPVLLKK